MKKGFYVQLHLHTSETSACGKASAAELVRACKAAGYDMIAITDHFINSNIGCAKDLPWPEKVEYLFRGYYAAKAEGDKVGLEVIRGWETAERIRNTDQYLNTAELLTYGLDEAFLLANPDIADIPYYEYIRRVTEAGGLIVHAHPYRQAHYIVPFTPDPESVQAYEVYNDHNKDPEWNRQARAEAEKCGLLMLAGSDAHNTESVVGGAMRFDRPVHSMAEIFDALRAGDGEIIEKMPAPENLW